MQGMREKIRQDLLHYQRAHQYKRNQQLHYLAFLAAFIGSIFLLIDRRRFDDRFLGFTQNFSGFLSEVSSW